ncbi:MAG: hypothetical protein ABGY41_08380, partial [Candidatus Poribacteria bacterium]
MEDQVGEWTSGEVYEAEGGPGLPNLALARRGRVEAEGRGFEVAAVVAKRLGEARGMAEQHVHVSVAVKILDDEAAGSPHRPEVGWGVGIDRDARR